MKIKTLRGDEQGIILAFSSPLWGS